MMNPEQLASMRKSDQLTALRSLLVELSRDIDDVDARIRKLEAAHEKLVAQRNQVLGQVAALENAS